MRGHQSEAAPAVGAELPAVPEPDLAHHGDAEVGAGLVDLAVNVRQAPLPPWLAGPIAATLTDLARYPDPSSARAAVAARHRRHPDEVLLTAGAAEGFVLIAQALRGVRRPVVVHPSSPSRRRRCEPPGTRWSGFCWIPPRTSGSTRPGYPQTPTS
ncbi:hypothetical protein GCM10027614_33170 [Micromonospora vulcania]